MKFEPNQERYFKYNPLKRIVFHKRSNLFLSLSPAMEQGGPFPSSSDSHFTMGGTDFIE